MKRSMLRTVFLFIATALLIGCISVCFISCNNNENVPPIAYDKEDYPESYWQELENIYNFKASNWLYEISPKSKDISGEIVLPPHYKGYPLVVGDFSGCKNITSVVFGDHVHNIKENAFKDCHNLTSVTFSDNVSDIADNAFFNCTGLETLIITDLKKWCGIRFGNEYSNPMIFCNTFVVNGTLTQSLDLDGTYPEVSDYAFSGKVINSVSFSNEQLLSPKAFTECTNLMYADVPAQLVRYMPHNALQSLTVKSGTTLEGEIFGYPELRSLELGLSVQSLGRNAFSNCPKLSDISATESLIEIGAGAFADTAWYDSQPHGPIYIGKVVFGNWHLLEACTCPVTLTIKDGTVSIADGAFNNCTNIREIVIPESVTSIGDRAFENCSNLNFLTIPASVNHIGKGIVVGCTKLSNLNVIPGSYWSQDGVIYNSKKTNIVAISPYTRIISLPNNVTELPANAFEGATNLKEIIIPKSVTHVGQDVFAGCKQIEKLFLPDNLKYLSKDAFDNNVVIKQASLPTSAISAIPKNYLEKITLLSGEEIGYEQFKNCSTLKSIVFPEGLKKIGAYAFYNCTALEKIELPNNVDYIEMYAFLNCTGLKEISIPRNASHVHINAFTNCTNVTIASFSADIADCIPKNNLEKIVLTGGTNIAPFTFANCKNLKSVTIEYIAIRRIIDGAFANCMNLTDIYYLGTIHQWEYIDKTNLGGTAWDDGIPNYTVHCSDGDIIKE